MHHNRPLAEDVAEALSVQPAEIQNSILTCACVLFILSLLKLQRDGNINKIVVLIKCTSPPSIRADSGPILRLKKPAVQPRQNNHFIFIIFVYLSKGLVKIWKNFRKRDFCLHFCPQIKAD